VSLRLDFKELHVWKVGMELAEAGLPVPPTAEWVDKSSE